MQGHRSPPVKRRRITRHHNLAKARGGSGLEHNIIHLTDKHHVAYHTLFGNRTVKEAIEVLERLEERIGRVPDG